MNIQRVPCVLWLISPQITFGVNSIVYAGKKSEFTGQTHGTCWRVLCARSCIFIVIHLYIHNISCDVGPYIIFDQLLHDEEAYVEEENIG